ncbi:MAG TPA: M67 family metallopeptidase [Acidimicrobiales bacterium]|nr:M67 family metallopeptidase [Acidimicrobiales bacterium]
MLELPAAVVDEVVAACLAGYPLEVCGLLAGSVTADGSSALVASSTTTPNAAASARVYTVEPVALLRADRAADDAGLTLCGVWHSHTHTDAVPSPTDVAAAPDPGWWYLLVSLRDVEPKLRAWRIRDGVVEEDAVAVR